MSNKKKTFYKKYLLIGLFGLIIVSLFSADNVEFKGKTHLNQKVFNVKEFGAVGDGINDDSVFIQKALEEAENRGGGIVLLPIGTYSLSNPIHIGSNVSLKGEGINSVLEGKSNGSYEGNAMIYNKGREITEQYGGASNFSIENLSINSKGSEMQGIYLDNAYDYYVDRIWGLGETLYHYFDINNSKKGLVENIHLVKDPQGTAPFQIDSRNIKNERGETDGLVVRNLTIINNNCDPDLGVIHSDYAAIHFHNFGTKNIHIDGLYTEGMPVVVYKDNNMDLENVLIENVVAKNVDTPIFIGYGYNKNITIRKWNIESNNFQDVQDSINEINGVIMKDMKVKSESVLNNQALELINYKHVD